jgi:hypothetical protein
MLLPGISRHCHERVLLFLPPDIFDRNTRNFCRRPANSGKCHGNSFPHFAAADTFFICRCVNLVDALSAVKDPLR